MRRGASLFSLERQREDGRQDAKCHVSGGGRVKMLASRKVRAASCGDGVLWRVESVCSDMRS